MKLTTGDRIVVWVGATLSYTKWEVIGPVKNDTAGFRGYLCKIVKRTKNYHKYCVAQPVCHWISDEEVQIYWNSWYAGQTIKTIKYLSGRESLTWDLKKYENQ